MKIGIVLDNKVNKWALQRFEPLSDRLDITIFVGEKNDYDVNSIELKKRFLTHREEISLALMDPVTAYRRTIGAPYKKMDYYYHSLKKHLAGFDLIFSCDITRSAYTLSSLKDELGFKILLSWWENIPYKAVLNDKANFHKKLVMQKVDKFLPFTHMGKKILLTENVPEDRIEVISPGVDLDRFTPGDKPLDLLAENNLDPDTFAILYVGKLTSWKGVHNLVYSAGILKSMGVTDFVFLIAGRGAQKEALLKLIEETGTEANFRFLNFISYDKMHLVYRMADILTLPSYPTMEWQEQFGMVLAESMASGKPVISTLSGSIPEVVGEAGILIPPGDSYGLAENILRLKRDRTLRDRLSLLSLERARSTYDTKKVSMKLESLLLDEFQG
jgi:glycosyltransferase involved in cell wall biosynthesis